MKTINLDADVASADWTKQSWDLPPYKSDAFFEQVKDLESFRKLPVYQAAVDAGLIHDDEWVADYCTPATEAVQKEWTASTVATSGITAYGSTKERRKKRRVKLLPSKEGD